MTKKIRRCFVLLTLFWTLAAFLCSPLIVSAADGTGDIVIFHTNDMHGRIVAGDERGTTIGLAEITAAVKNAKEKNPNTLWLDAGDILHGMPRINVSLGENMVSLLNISEVDAMVPGNHDFNYGADQTMSLVDKMTFPVLSANTVQKGEHKKRLFSSYTIFTLPNQIRVAVFGLTTPETAYKTSPQNVETLEFLNPVETAKELVKELRPQCDVLVALVHMGLDKSSEFTSEKIAKEVPDIDLIVDGHSHTLLSEGLAVGNTLIVQTGSYGSRLGQATLQVENHHVVSKKAKLLDATDVKQIAPIPDAKMAQALLEMEKKNAELFSRIVTKSDRRLTADRQIVRSCEGELGDLCTDALRWYTNSDFAVINGGAIRADLPQGSVTLGDILAIFPFGNTVKTVEIKGSVLRSMLEHSVYGYPATFGGFLQVSGLKFAFDPSAPVGKRVTEIYVKGEILDEERIYKMTTLDFLLYGGDDYKMLKGLKVIGEMENCEDIFVKYLSQMGTKNIEQGRITILNKSQSTRENEKAALQKAA